MSATHALFPGTFDPPTRGHLDIVRRTLALFEKVTVAVAVHPGKQAIFDSAARIELWRACLDDTPGADLVEFDGLVVDGCRAVGAEVIVRGVRSGTDLDYEVQMARTNRELLPEVDTVFLSPSPEFAHVSSTLVRQIASMGGDASPFVPEPVAVALRERFGGK